MAPRWRSAAAVCWIGLGSTGAKVLMGSWDRQCFRHRREPCMRRSPARPCNSCSRWDLRPWTRRPQCRA
jgi:hypothetical protein